SRAVPPRPSTLVTSVDPRLERVIVQALSPDPRDRPESATAVLDALSAPAAPQLQRRRWWIAAAAVAAALVAAVIAVPFLFSRGDPSLTERDTLVLADFANTTGDPVFDGALKVALTVAIEQSPFLKVFPDERVRETLRLMDRSPDEHVTRTIAREVAQREQLKALIAGSIAPLGRNYV